MYAATTAMVTSAGTVSATLAKQWTSMEPNLVDHYAGAKQHGQQFAELLRQRAYTLEQYAADAYWTLQNGYHAVDQVTGANVYVYF